MENQTSVELLFVTIAVAGEMLAIRRTTVYRLLSEGGLTAAKIGTRRLVTIASVKSLAAKLTESP